MAEAVLRLWDKHKRAALLAGLAVMAIAAAYRWPHELHRALVEVDGPGLDLRLRYDELRSWFAGQELLVDSSATYPPASYIILWPALGWPSLAAARWAWTATCVLLLAFLAAAAIRAGGARERLEQAFLAMFFFSAYAPLVTIGNGQLTIHVLAALTAAFVLAKRGTPPATAGSIALFLVALVKPNLAAPFFWVFLFSFASWRPGLFVGAGYLVLTWLASLWQPQGVVALLARWVETSSLRIVKLAYSDIPVWMDAVGLRDYAIAASIAALATLGVWVWRRRNADLLLLLGAVSVAARIWTKHLLFDDMLVFGAMVALWRLAHADEETVSTRAAALILFFGNWLAQTAPVSVLQMGPPWRLSFQVLQTALWGATLLFLMRATARRLTPLSRDTP